VRAGATVVGPRPQRSPSLTDFPECDAQVKNLADELWGRCDGTRVRENADGQGRIVWGKSLAEVFSAQNLKPDFEYQARTPAPGWLTFIASRTRRTFILFPTAAAV